MLNRVNKLMTLLLFLPLMNCNQNKIIDVQGHRGCRGLLPENTIPAFRKAIQSGVNTLELDVVVSKDNIVVVSHEPFMNPEICYDFEGKDIKNKDILTYNIYQMSFDSIKKYDCGLKIHPRFPQQEKIKTTKPSLDEVIKISKSLNQYIKFNIELKSQAEYYGKFIPYPKEFVSLVLTVLNKNQALESCNLQSFDLRILEEIKVQSPNMVVALLVDEYENISEKLNQLSYKPEIVSPYFKLLDSNTVRALHKDKFMVIPWTVNKEEDMQKLKDLKVDGIITDYPNKLINLLNE